MSGVMKGAVTYLRFRVECKHPDEMYEKYMARIRARARSVSWTPRTTAA